MSETKKQSPFAALTFAEQQDRWREWRSRQLDYQSAGELPPVELPPADEPPPASERTPAAGKNAATDRNQAPGEAPRAADEPARAVPRPIDAPAPTRHRQCRVAAARVP